MTTRPIANVPTADLPTHCCRIPNFKKHAFREEVSNQDAQYTYRVLWDPKRGLMQRLLPCGVDLVVHSFLYGPDRIDRSLSLPAIYCHTSQRLACATMRRLMDERANCQELQVQLRELRARNRELRLNMRRVRDRRTANRTRTMQPSDPLPKMEKEPFPDSDDSSEGENV